MQKKNILSQLKIFIIISISFFILSHESFASNIEGIQTYHKNLQLYPENKQQLAEDINRYQNADNLWDVLREEFSLPHYEDNPAVQEKIEWFMNNQDFLLRSASRSAPYLYYILQQIKKRHLPAELVLLPIIESGYNPFSLSNMGAAGIWQLMPNTATGLGVRQDRWYDGRRDVITSTRAALNHLAYLQSFFEGNWLLTIAAYNTGEGNVLAALKKNIRNGISTNFWSLPLAQQTKDYVPSLLALAVIISNPYKYPLYFPPVRNAPYLAQVDTGNQINFKYAAQLAGISYKKILQLNPGFSHNNSAKGPFKLVLPIENVEQFTTNLARSPLNHQIDWIHYKVKTGDTIFSIARKFNTTSLAIRKMNHLNKNNVRSGINLLIPNNNSEESEPMIADNNSTITKTVTSNLQKIAVIKKENTNEVETDSSVSNDSYVIKNAREIAQSFKSTSNYTLKPGDTIYMVRMNDTLKKIAEHFHVTIASIISANKLQNGLTPNRQIIIPTHTANPSYAANKNNLAPGDTVYMIRRGDTLERIAEKFNTSSSAIRVENLMTSNHLTEGDRIIIPTHLQS